MLLMSFALGLEASGVEDAVSIWLFWRGEGDLEETFFDPSPEFVSWKGPALFKDIFDVALVVVVAVERLEVDGGGGEFDKIDVEDVDEFLGIIE